MVALLLHMVFNKKPCILFTNHPQSHKFWGVVYATTSFAELSNAKQCKQHVIINTTGCYYFIVNSDLNIFKRFIDKFFHIRTKIFNIVAFEYNFVSIHTCASQ